MGVETVVPNILANAEFESMPQSLEARLRRLSLKNIAELWDKIQYFWNVPGYHIPDTKQRLIDCGLWTEPYKPAV